MARRSAPLIRPGNSSGPWDSISSARLLAKPALNVSTPRLTLMPPSPLLWLANRATPHVSSPRTTRKARPASTGTTAWASREFGAVRGIDLVCGAVKRPYRVVVAKPGLDGHDRGAKTITRALRDAGFEVIYTGLHQTPEQIAETTLQEDADAVGLSLLSGAHLTLFPRVMAELKARGLDDVIVFGGGVIPDEDVAALQAQGVAALFTPGSSLTSISTWLEAALDARSTEQPA